ncbi:MAG: hypothetical protein D6714_01670 [Bacteroidetes bacterium]|nr:MAG: hypothetical protein D6714_01670 [Bacteroidota bacterium]
MRKNRFLPAIMLLLFIIALILFNLRGNSKLSWQTHYLSDSADPYGKSVLRNLLEKQVGDTNFIEINIRLDGILPDTFDRAIYVFIGEKFHLDSANQAALFNFITAGNTAFIATSDIDGFMISDLLFEAEAFACKDASGVWRDGGFRTLTDSVVTLGAVPNRFRPFSRRPTLTFVGEYGVEPYAWQYFPDESFCGYTPRLLGVLNEDYANFCVFPFDGGELYLHSTPLAFTNYALVEKDRFAYAQWVFGQFWGRKIFWDNLPARKDSSSGGSSSPNAFNRGPLQYILSQPALAWAWYILLAMALLYVIFRAKRRQRVIPVLATKANTSLEFIQTIGRLYFNQNNHKKLAMHKMTLFLNFVRRQYPVRAKISDADFARQLSEQSHVPRELIEHILSLHARIRNKPAISAGMLTDFHRALDKFYRTCK